MNQTIMRTKIIHRICEVPAHEWDECALPLHQPFHPFVCHAYLNALEISQCVGEGSGWLPHHIILEDEDGVLAGCMPLYIKLHSLGEYVFDSAFADAYHRLGGNYYPKLQCAVPFTPVTGPRLFVKNEDQRVRVEKLLIEKAKELAYQLHASSLHLTFTPQGEWESLGQLGLLQRIGQQFHWLNENYKNFEDFLQTLSSRKRKMIRKERSEALKEGITIEFVSGSQITESDWDFMFEIYVETSSRKWGRPYLNRRFFSEVGAALGRTCVLILATRGGRKIAGALHFLGGDCLYGRYWGALEHVPYLHFELCYYQAIEYAITHGLKRVEAGAQGEHKLLRGYLPHKTYSCHWFADKLLEGGVRAFLQKERQAVEESNKMLTLFTPFKKGSSQEDNVEKTL